LLDPKRFRFTPSALKMRKQFITIVRNKELGLNLKLKCCRHAKNRKNIVPLNPYFKDFYIQKKEIIEK